MHLGKLCRYAKDCSVYNNENHEIKRPIFLVRNVFCNRGPKGWNNCKRFLLYENNINVPDNMIP